MAASSTSTDAGLKERFFRYYQQETAALREQIERLNSVSAIGGERNDAIDHCLAGIDRLSHEVKDASAYIPAYDQRTYSQGIKELSEKLQEARNSFNPPKKFSFKTRKNASAISISDAAELAQSQKLRAPVYASDTSNANSSFAPTPLDRLSPGEQKAQHEAMGIIEEDGLGGISNSAEVQRPAFPNATQISISNRDGLRVQVPASAHHATSSGTISNLQRCIIDLSAPTAGVPFSALYVKDIKRSLIICGRVAGAVHITGVEDSLIITTCRQFRMHASKNVDIYLHSASRPIIEDCTNVRFAPMLNGLESPGVAQVPNQWDQIDDFKWLKAGPSPNFSILPELERLNEQVWKDNMMGLEGTTSEGILKAFKIPV